MSKYKESFRTLYCKIKKNLNYILSEKSYKRYEIFLLNRNSQDKVMKEKFLPEEKIHLIK